MTIYTSNKFRTCSCTKCKQEISITNFSRHYNNKSCNATVNNEYNKCKYCKCDTSLMAVSARANHVQWCIENPNIVDKKSKKAKQLNSTWETNHDCRLAKMKETKLRNFGNENYCNHEKIKETKLVNHGDSGFNNRPKSIVTCNILYGCDNPNQNQTIKDKTVSTNLLRYGVTTCLVLPENRPSNTNRSKAEETMLFRYGAKHSSQIPHIFIKMQSHRSTNKTFVFPSGNTYMVQGYEPIAIQELIDSGYTELDIQLTNRKAIKYEFNNKISYYHPDIIIPKENRIIEVKSKYWFEREYDKNMAKQLACISQGYLFEFKVY